MHKQKLLGEPKMVMKISQRQLRLIGNVGKAPKRASTPSGVQVVDFSVASKFSLKIDGKWVDETEWTNCKLFGDSVDTFMKHVASGTRIFVEGHFRTEKYTSNDQPRTKHYVLVETFIPLSKKNVMNESSDAPNPADELDMATA
jgi:single-strand DNA-binding protein